MNMYFQPSIILGKIIFHNFFKTIKIVRLNLSGLKYNKNDVTSTSENDITLIIIYQYLYIEKEYKILYLLTLLVIHY